MFKHKCCVIIKQSILMALALSSLLVSCNDRGTGKIRQKDFSGKSLGVRADSLLVSVAINPLYGKINANNIVLGSSANGDGVLNVFSLPDMEFRYSAIRRGRGPGEFLAINWANSLIENTVTLYDIPGARIRSFRVSRDTLMLTREYELKEKMDDGSGLTMPYVAMVQLNESQFITRAAARTFDDLKLQDMATGETISIVPELLERDPERSQYTSYYYVFGFGNDRLVKAYEYFDRIEIFRKNEDDSFSPEVTITDSRNYESNLDSEEKTSYYQSVVCGTENIYLLYSGEKEGSAVRSCIEIFDYEGNSVSLISLDRVLSMIMVDEPGRKLYGIDPYNPDYIFVYDL